MQTTQRKGDIGKAQAIATFTKMGFNIAMLLTESAPYDLIVDSFEGLKRVQIKYITGKEVDLRKISCNTKGYKTKFSQANEYDWLYVYRADGNEYLIKNCLIRRSFTPQEEHRIN